MEVKAAKKVYFNKVYYKIEIEAVKEAEKEAIKKIEKVEAVKEVYLNRVYLS